MAGELVAQPAAGEDRELELLALVRLPQLVGRDLADPVPEAPGRRLVVHRVEVGVGEPLERVADRLAQPGRRVDAVGEPEDLVRADALPGGVRGVPVELRDRVRPVRHAQAQRGHVELRGVVLDAQAEAQEPLHRDAARARPPVAVEERTGDPAHEVGVEALVARGDRGVDREHAVAPDRGERVVEGPALRHELAGALREQERGVALVEVPDRGVEAQRPQRPDPADAEDELLVEPHLAAADVQDVGDRAVGVVVVGDVGVEQQHGHPADLDDPDGREQVAAGQRDADRERLAERVEGALDRQARRARSRGRRAPGARPRRWSGGSSPCGT